MTRGRACGHFLCTACATELSLQSTSRGRRNAPALCHRRSVVRSGCEPEGYFRICFLLFFLIFFSLLASWLLGFSASWLLGFWASWLLLGFLAFRLLGFSASWLSGLFGFLLVYAAFAFLAFRLFASSAFPVPLRQVAFWLLRLFAGLCGFWRLWGLRRGAPHHRHHHHPV